MVKQARSSRNSPKIKKKGNESIRRKGFVGKSNPSLKRRPAKLNPKLQDARQKLIQKKRRPVIDARDVIAKVTKSQDARSRLDHMRSKPRGSNTSVIAPTNSKIKVIGNNIVQKVDVNGKISLVTNKAKNTSNINIAIQKQLGLLPAFKPPLKRNLPRKPQHAKSVQSPWHSVSSERKYWLPSFEVPKAYNQEMIRWLRPDLRPASHLNNLLEPTRQAMRDVMREELLIANRGWSNFITPKQMKLHPSSYIDLDVADDEEMPIVQMPANRVVLKNSNRARNIHSRLDGNQRSHGIMSDIKTKVVIPVGHRIIVSNLHPSVTEEDIKELFEDIGPLLSVKLVRPGVAEVIYQHLKDGHKAVDSYHNRQLDGQPMKCLLVNQKPLYQPTNTRLPNTKGSLGERPIFLDRFDMDSTVRRIPKSYFQT